MTQPCAVQVWDRRATRSTGRVTIRACGAATRMMITVGGDVLLAACGRHNRRLQRAFPTIEFRSGNTTAN